MQKFFLIIWAMLWLTACKKNVPGGQDLTAPAPGLVMHEEHVDAIINGYYSALPATYYHSDEKYPTIIFLHGTGQVGKTKADLPLVLYGGIPKVIEDKKFPATVQGDGREFSFIILVPQFRWWPSTEQVMTFIDHMKTKYRVDESRLYLSGLSGGGILTTAMAADYPKVFAAAVPIAGVYHRQDVAHRCAVIAASGLPLWIFQNEDDQLFDIADTRRFVQLCKFYDASPALRYTEFLPYGVMAHDAWTIATDPDYKEDNLNIYQWMLQFTNHRP